MRRYIHRLVLQAFVGGGDGMDCNHLNGNKSDNRLVNLEWLTRGDNHRHRYRELGHTSPMKGRGGSAHPRAKKYLVTHPCGKKEVIHGLSAFCREMGMDVSGLYRVMSGEWKLHKGFKCESIITTG